MLGYMVNLFISGFVYHGILWNQALMGIGLGIAFGAIWYVAYWTPIFKKPWSWAVLAGSAILTWTAVSFIQVPLQFLTGRALNFFWSQEILTKWILIAAIPSILLTGIVQEGSKLVPVVIYWWRKGKNIDPKLGLAIGAAAGLGFGVFEAVWVHNTIFLYGWNLEAAKTAGLFIAVLPFLERFFIVSFHAASSAIAGWGLAKGWGWQFYLISSFSHAVINYSAVISNTGLVSQIQLEAYVVVWTIIVTGFALWLRWRKQK